MDGINTRMIDVGELSLHIAEAGPKDGPLTILLHGFPEYWLQWRDLMGPLARAGHRVVAPDQRGYNLSAKPKGAGAYTLDRLVTDVLGLADALGAERFRLVGHDWGAAVAWWAATIAPERLLQLVVMNAPHPALWRAAMDGDAAQRAKSRYVRDLRIPLIPELVVRAGGYQSLAAGLRSGRRPESFPPHIMELYQQAWRQPRALTAMISWYRDLFRQDLPIPGPREIPCPTLILWGDQDQFAERGLAADSAALCRQARVQHFPEATHWLPHDEPEAVRDALLAFLA